ncbi:TMEM165/GDT1 family protein [Actinomycetospora cinnamomea]|uniref:GDT1 family protein n=1 Tax=Actinomycetospora cinnamomea TaxID=663609 RepID=A0A2U1EBI5_9PSEU|nr:TMEM165/GDT1 family protein [Actinomycetospora cinnamomea]PVY97270.1 putative Ca2+/H+ antiporter (TMEM165/GDT1 family) [Actinomycetospora cinnamomea]
MTVAAITFGLVFLAEMADTSGLVTLVLASRLPARWVLLGVCAGMLVHVGVALAAGGLLALLPGRLLEAVLALIFLVGAFLIYREGEEDDDDDIELRATPKTRWGVVATAFGVTALSEFADPSQIIAASLAARYDDLLAVGIGAVLGLWAVSAIAVWGGDRLRRLVPVRWVTRVAALIMVGLAVWAAVEAIVG